jgi:hypothetical protein
MKFIERLYRGKNPRKNINKENKIPRKICFEKEVNSTYSKL